MQPTTEPLVKISPLVHLPDTALAQLVTDALGVPLDITSDPTGRWATATANLGAGTASIVVHDDGYTRARVSIESAPDPDGLLWIERGLAALRRWAGLAQLVARGLSSADVKAALASPLARFVAGAPTDEHAAVSETIHLALARDLEVGGDDSPGAAFVELAAEIRDLRVETLTNN